MTKSKHDQAMDIAEKGMLAKYLKRDNYLNLFSQAYDLERSAADEYTGESAFDRSVLYSSAAQLAFEVGKLQECEECCYKALAGQLPDDITADLKKLLEKCTLQSRLFHVSTVAQGLNLIAAKEPDAEFSSIAMGIFVSVGKPSLYTPAELERLSTFGFNVSPNGDFFTRQLW